MRLRYLDADFLAIALDKEISLRPFMESLDLAEGRVGFFLRAFEAMSAESIKPSSLVIFFV